MLKNQDEDKAGLKASTEKYSFIQFILFLLEISVLAYSCIISWQTHYTGPTEKHIQSTE